MYRGLYVLNPIVYNMNYLKKIKVEARKRKIPLKQLANSVNLSEETFKKSLKDNNLSISQLEMVCNELGINVHDLFSLENAFGMELDHNLNFLNNKAFC